MRIPGGTDKGSFIILSQYTHPIQVQTYSLEGRLLSTEMLNGSTEYSLKIPTASSGKVYIIELSSGSEKLREKILIP